MVNIVRTEWAGTSGGPGLTQFALTQFAGEGTAQAAVNAVRAFWAALVNYLPNELTLTVSPVVDQYNTETGELIGSVLSPTSPAVVVGAYTGSYSGGSGFKTTWETGQIAHGRRVRGSTFIVPGAGTSFTATGTVNGATITAVNAAAATLLSTLDTNLCNLVVWSRPRDLPVPRIGAEYEVTQGICGSKSAIMRSRRD